MILNMSRFHSVGHGCGKIVIVWDLSATVWVQYLVFRTNRFE